MSARPGESAEQALARSGQDFKQVREVLQALAESDEALKEEMRRVVQAGINGPQGAGTSLGELPIVLMTDGNGGELSAQQLAQAITTRIIGEMLGAHDALFERGFAALVAFKAEHGHCKVPKRHKAASFNLGWWLRYQRTAAKNPNYPADRRERLEALGVRLETRAAQAQTTPAASDPTFTEFPAQARAFHAEHGHCDVPLEFGPLGAWCANQRWAAGRGLLTPERLEELMELGVIQPDGPARDRIRA